MSSDMNFIREYEAGGGDPADLSYMLRQDIADDARHYIEGHVTERSWHRRDGTPRRASLGPQPLSEYEEHELELEREADRYWSIEDAAQHFLERLQWKEGMRDYRQQETALNEQEWASKPIWQRAALSTYYSVKYALIARFGGGRGKFG